MESRRLECYKRMLAASEPRVGDHGDVGMPIESLLISPTLGRAIDRYLKAGLGSGLNALNVDGFCRAVIGAYDRDFLACIITWLFLIIQLIRGFVSLSI
jgi:hypothetical protein